MKKSRPWHKLTRKEAQHRRRIGYNVEHESVKKFEKEYKPKAFCMRIPSFLQRGKLRYVDFIIAPEIIFGQAKYKKHYYKKGSEEDLGLRALAIEYNSPCTILSWRDRGIKWEMPYIKPR